MSDLDSQKAPPSFLADDVPASEVERERRYKETLAMLRALESDKHVATVCEPHMSRYTIEWNGQALPVGTRLYARTPQAEAKAGVDYAECCDTPAYCSSVRRCTAQDETRAQPKPAEGGAVDDNAWFEKIEIDHDGSLKITLRDVNPNWAMQQVTSRVFAPAGSGEADYKCRAYACRRVRVEMQAEISRLRAGSGEAVATGIVGWIHEDQLPDGYPYEAMFRHSKVDGVRMFPVFAPAAAAEALSNAASALVRLVEGPGCLRWEDGSGSRLKDTNEWCAFYCAARRLAGGEGA